MFTTTTVVELTDLFIASMESMDVDEAHKAAALYRLREAIYQQMMRLSEGGLAPVERVQEAVALHQAAYMGVAAAYMRATPEDEWLPRGA